MSPKKQTVDWVALKKASNGLITRMALILDYLAPEVADQLLESHGFGNVEISVIESRR